jgi:hypothetical protein
MKKDPVCNMEVSEETALTTECDELKWKMGTDTKIMGSGLNI